jgi:hypothetical protein
VTTVKKPGAQWATTAEGIDTERTLWFRDIRPLVAQGWNLADIARKLELDEVWIEDIAERCAELPLEAEHNEEYGLIQSRASTGSEIDAAGIGGSWVRIIGARCSQVVSLIEQCVRRGRP